MNVSVFLFLLSVFEAVGAAQQQQQHRAACHCPTTIDMQLIRATNQRPYLPFVNSNGAAFLGGIVQSDGERVLLIGPVGGVHHQLPGFQLNDFARLVGAENDAERADVFKSLPAEIQRYADELKKRFGRQWSENITAETLFPSRRSYTMHSDGLVTNCFIQPERLTGLTIWMNTAVHCQLHQLTLHRWLEDSGAAIHRVTVDIHDETLDEWVHGVPLFPPYCCCYHTDSDNNGNGIHCGKAPQRRPDAVSLSLVIGSRRLAPALIPASDYFATHYATSKGVVENVEYHASLGVRSVLLVDNYYDRDAESQRLCFERGISEETRNQTHIIYVSLPGVVDVVPPVPCEPWLCPRWDFNTARASDALRVAAFNILAELQSNRSMYPLLRPDGVIQVDSDEFLVTGSSDAPMKLISAANDMFLAYPDAPYLIVDGVQTTRCEEDAASRRLYEISGVAMCLQLDGRVVPNELDGTPLASNPKIIYRPDECRSIGLHDALPLDSRRSGTHVATSIVSLRHARVYGDGTPSMPSNNTVVERVRQRMLANGWPRHPCE